jgi:hypothetical protein
MTRASGERRPDVDPNLSEVHHDIDVIAAVAVPTFMLEPSG